MKKLTKQSLDELARMMSVIPESDLNGIVGAYYNDCFWRCIAYVNSGGSSYSEADAAGYANAFFASAWGGYTEAYLTSFGAGMSSSQINDYSAMMMSAGIFSLSEISNGTSFAFNNQTGKLKDGGSLMVRFNNASGGDHIVIVTKVNSDGSMEYFDPSTGKSESLAAGQYSGLYSIN